MRLLKFLGFVLIFVLSALRLPALAADDGTSLVNFKQLRFPAEQTESGAIFLPALRGNSPQSVFAQVQHSTRIDITPLTGVCFTMRSYQVKRAERLRDGESGAITYSTCQMGSEYSIRSADVSNSK